MSSTHSGAQHLPPFLRTYLKFESRFVKDQQLKRSSDFGRLLYSGGPFNGPLQVLKFEVRVDFRRAEITVAKQLLHVPDAGAAAQQMRRAGVAKGVHAGFDFRLQSVVANALRDHLIRETTAGY